MASDIFAEINNAVLDLQSAQLQTYERPLKRLSQLLKHPDLRSYNDELTSGLDLEAFIDAGKNSGGSMVGSSTLPWPDDANQELGLTILLIEKFGSDPNYAIDFSHDFYYAGTKVINSIHALTGQLIIPFVRDYKNFVRARGSSTTTVRGELSRKVFIVHGHDDGARETVARFVERIGLEAIILREQANQGRTIIEKVEAYSDVGFAVILLTPDDEGCVKGGVLAPRARQNVLLELGYFIGRLGRDKVCALMRGTLEIPSDYSGVVWERMDSSDGWKQALARELQAAGHDINWNKVMTA